MCYENFPNGNSVAGVDMHWIAMAVGGFYVVAGVIALRMMRLDRLMDGVLAALEGKPQPANERWKSAILTTGSFLTLTSGAALAMLSAWALPLFLANALVQGGYLAWAERALPPADTDEVQGRRQTKNAFVVYLAACAFVVWVSARGQMRPWPLSVEAMLADAFAIGGIALAGWASMFIPSSWFSRTSSTSESVGAAIPDADTVPKHLRLAPDWQRWPLWDAETGDNVSYFRLNLPDALAERIEAWDDAWQETYNGDDPPSSGFKTEIEQQSYVDEGRSIVQELRRVWSGRVEISDEFR